MINPENRQQLVRLVTKFLNGQATPEEKAFLEQYYNYFDAKGSPPSQLSSLEKEALEAKMLDHIFSEIDKRESGKRPRLKIPEIARVAALIAALIAVAGMLYFQGRKSRPAKLAQQTEKPQTQSDIKPGGNKAVLTLANGTRVVLDSARNGALATQGSSSIIKLDSGQMAYRPTLYDKNGQQSQGKAGATVAYNTLSTPRGGSYQLTLPDGSKVWLNSASSLTFPVEFADGERRVSLKGEAYFEVKKSKFHPFIVETHNIEIRDLGTQFNVMAYADEPDIRTTLVEGAVQVVQGAKNVLLKPGEQAIVTGEQKGKIIVTPTDIDAAIAWKSGYFSFHHTSIYEIMRQISRWYDVDVSYGDSLSVSLNGHISRNVNASEVFKMLELTGELHFTIADEKVIVRETRTNHS